jgi:hypothetical protein
MWHSVNVKSAECEKRVPSTGIQSIEAFNPVPHNTFTQQAISQSVSVSSKYRNLINVKHDLRLILRSGPEIQSTVSTKQHQPPQ